MRIFVKAKPGSKNVSVRRAAQDEGLFSAGKPAMKAFVVAVKERPTGGQANRAIERAIAEYFHVAPSRVRIVAGHASREKVLEVGE